MRLLILITIIALSFSCSDQRKSNFEEVACNPELKSMNDNLRNVFKPCRTYVYSAKFWDKDYNLISEELIRVVATGKDWDVQPDQQDEIVIQYQFEEDEIEKLTVHNLNPEHQNWTSQSTTGIIETASKTWMHPFRSNQYTFTEVAPFPEVVFPLEAGKSWRTTLSIYEGWGDWSDSQLNCFYNVLGRDSLELSFGEVPAWQINSFSKAGFGASSHNFWYNEDFGFVKMVVKNYGNQLVQFELIEIIDSERDR